MPSHNSGGTVLDVSLTTVKVQNWDRTVTTIPTCALVAEPFKNWRGMEESEGRRINGRLGHRIPERCRWMRCANSIHRERTLSRGSRCLDARGDPVEEMNEAVDLPEQQRSGVRCDPSAVEFRAYLQRAFYELVSSSTKRKDTAGLQADISAEAEGLDPPLSTTPSRTIRKNSRSSPRPHQPVLGKAPGFSA